MPSENTTPLVCCEITGKQVPEQDTVILHGQRVCAEGKRILLESRNHAPPRVEIRTGTEEPPLWRRSAAAAIDFFLALALLTLMFVTLGIIDGLAPGPGISAFVEFASKNILLLMVVPQCLYAILMLGWRGQTLGKMICRIVVVRNDGTGPIGWPEAIARALAHRGPELIGGGMALALSLKALDEQIAFMGVGLSILYLVVSAIVAVAAGDRQRSIHDKMTGTRVVVKTRG